MAASYFLLLVQKKVTKEKDTLAAAVCRHPCRQTARAGSGVRREHIRVLSSNARASCARPFGLFPRLLAAVERDPGRAERGSPCRRSESPPRRSTTHPLSRSRERARVRAGSRVPSEQRRRANGKAARTAAGGARDRADFDNRPWMACGPNPFARSEPLAARAARIRGCRFLWLLSFGQAKESNRPPWMADETHTDVSRFSRSAQDRTQKGKVKMDSGFRRNDEELDSGLRRNEEGVSLRPGMTEE